MYICDHLQGTNSYASSWYLFWIPFGGSMALIMLIIKGPHLEHSSTSTEIKAIKTLTLHIHILLFNCSVICLCKFMYPDIMETSVPSLSGPMCMKFMHRRHLYEYFDWDLPFNGEWHDIPMRSRRFVFFSLKALLQKIRRGNTLNNVGATKNITFIKNSWILQ